MAETVTIGAAELEALIAAALVASNTAEANARSVARALAQAEIDGQKGHGLSRVPTYAAQARAGKVDGHATPVVRQTRPGALMIDVANGFAFPAIDLAVERLPGLAGASRHRRGGLRALASLRRRRPPRRAAGGGGPARARLRQHAQGDRAVGRQACAVRHQPARLRGAADATRRRSSSTWR